MIKSKKSLFVALILLIVSFFINFTFARSGIYGETKAAVFSIPIESSNGFNIIGFTSLLILIASLFFLSKSFNKYNARIVVIAIIIVTILPVVISSSSS